MARGGCSDGLSTGSWKNNDSTHGSEGLGAALRSEYSEASLPEETRALVGDVNRFLRGYLLRFLVLAALFLLFFSLFRATVFLVDVHFYHNSDRFLDRIHDRIDDRHLHFLKDFCDWLFYPYVALVALRFLLFYPPVFNVQLLLRFLTMYAFVYPLRALLVFFSSIPSPYPHCSRLRVAESGWRTFLEMLHRPGEVECSGRLFSGHAYVVALGFILLAQNSDLVPTLLMFVYAAVLCVTIVATKFHYSVDVMFSILFSGFLYYLYFTRIDSYGVHCLNRITLDLASPEERLRHSLLDTSTINAWFAWMEQISDLLSLGFRIKELHRAAAGSDLGDPRLARRLNLYVFLFGLANCDDLLGLYRGSRAFNFSYWTSLRRFISKRRNKVDAM